MFAPLRRHQSVGTLVGTLFRQHRPRCQIRSLAFAAAAESGRASPSQGQLQLVDLEDNFVRRLNVNVCGRFTGTPKVLRPWFLRYIPKGGLPMEISYIDTMPDADHEPNGKRPKVILALHNTPGSFYDFFELIATFGQDYRVIIPNFPDFQYTLKNGCFWHSAEEKSEFVADFLRALKIDTVDCLVAHSQAAYTASYMWIYANWADYIRIRSVALLAPVGMYKLKYLEKKKFRLMSQMCRYSLTRSILEKRIAVHKPKSRFMASTMQLAAKSGSLLANPELASWKALSFNLSGYEKYALRLRALKLSRIPVLFQFSSNDRLYTPNVFFDQLYELGAEYDSYDVYEQYENELVTSATNFTAQVRSVDFRSAGHYMFKTHPDIVHSYIAELIERADNLPVGYLERGDLK